MQTPRLIILNAESILVTPVFCGKLSHTEGTFEHSQFSTKRSAVTQKNVLSHEEIFY